MEINKVYLGDCLEVIKGFKDDSIDLIVTSPPYYNSQKKYQRGNGYHYVSDIGEPLYLIYDMFEIVKPKLKDEGAICINLAFSYSETGVMRPYDIINRVREKLGYFINDIIIWHKNNPIPINNRLTNAYEFIFVLSKTPYVKYYTTKYTHNVWTFPVDTGKKGHSAVYPIELPTNCIINFSKENDIILDPFAGSGTTGVACIRTKRKYILIEKEKKYYDIIIERINKEIEQQQINFEE